MSHMHQMQCSPTWKSHNMYNESTAQYLVRAKVLLECIHSMSKLWDISGFDLDNLLLVWGIREATYKDEPQRSKSPGEQWRITLRA